MRNLCFIVLTGLLSIGMSGFADPSNDPLINLETSNHHHHSHKKCKKREMLRHVDAFGSFALLTDTTIAVGDPVPFDFQFFPPIGIEHTLGTGTFLIRRSGFYEISYGVAQTATAAAVSLFLNGVAVNGSQIELNPVSLVSTSIIIHIEAGQTLSLVNNGIVAAPAATTRPAAQRAYITIERIRSHRHLGESSGDGAEVEFDFDEEI